MSPSSPFLLGILPAITLDLDNQVQEIVVAVAVVYADDKIRQVSPRFRAIAVRHFEAKIVILDVGSNLRMRFGDAAEFSFPVTIKHDPVNVAVLGACLPTV